MSDTDRFADDPSQLPGLTPEQIAASKARSDAVEEYRRTGDPSKARALGMRPRDYFFRERNESNRRFWDNPFRPADLPPERVAVIEARNAAMREYYTTGDPTKAKELGLLPQDVVPENGQDKEES